MMLFIDMMELLGSHSTDEEIGLTFWGSAEKMHSDVMAKDCDVLLKVKYRKI